METRLSGRLAKGDLIVVSINGGYLDLGFFLDGHTEGTLRYFSVQDLNNWFESRDTMLKKKRPYISFINKAYEDRVVKFHPDSFSEEFYDNEYLKALEALKLLKII